MGIDFSSPVYGRGPAEPGRGELPSRPLRLAARDTSAVNGGGSIVAIARGWIGTPYVHQASVKGAGCDCLGLLRGVWREVHGEEPEAAPAWVVGQAPFINGYRKKSGLTIPIAVLTRTT